MKLHAQTLALAALLATGAAATDAAADVGLRLESLTLDHRDQPVEAAIWYPAQAEGTAERVGDNPVFLGTEVYPDATPQTGAAPVVLLSHGLGGNTGTLGWLGAALAEAGAIVIAVNHPGSTTFDVDPIGSLDHGARARDLGAALDWLQGSGFAAQIEGQEVSAIGFSLGGFTALGLGGLQGNLPGYAAHCEAAGAASSHCRDLERWGMDLSALSPAQWRAPTRDSRISHVVAIDPGLTYGLEAADVAGLRARTLLVTLGAADTRLLATDISPEGSNLAGLLPGADWQVIAPGSHFSMLPVCKPAGAEILAAEGDDPVCDLAPGEDRRATHQAVIAAIISQIGL